MAKKGKKGKGKQGNKLPRAVQEAQNAQRSNAASQQAPAGGGGAPKAKKKKNNNAKNQKKASMTGLAAAAGAVVNTQAPMKPAASSAVAQGQLRQQQQQQPQRQQQQQQPHAVAAAGGSSIGHVGGQWQQPQLRQQPVPQQPQQPRGGAPQQQQQRPPGLGQPRPQQQPRQQQAGVVRQQVPAQGQGQMRGGQHPQLARPQGQGQRVPQQQGRFVPQQQQQQRGQQYAAPHQQQQQQQQRQAPIVQGQQRGAHRQQRGAQQPQVQQRGAPRQQYAPPPQQGQQPQQYAAHPQQPRGQQQQQQRQPQQGQQPQQYAAQPQQPRGQPQQPRQQQQQQYGGQPQHMRGQPPHMQQQQPPHMQQQPPRGQQPPQAQASYQGSRPPPVMQQGGGAPGIPRISSPGGNFAPSPSPMSSRASTASASSSHHSGGRPMPAAEEKQLAIAMDRMQLDDTRSQTSVATNMSASALRDLLAKIKDDFLKNPNPGTLGQQLTVVSNMYRANITVPAMVQYGVRCYNADGSEVPEESGPYRRDLYFALKRKLMATIGITFWNNTSLCAFYGKVGHTFQVDNISDRARRPIGRMELTCTNAYDLTGPEVPKQVQDQYIHIMLKQLAMDANLARLGRSYLEDQIFPKPTQQRQRRSQKPLVPYRSLGTQDHLEVHRGFQLSIEKVIRNMMMLKADIVHVLVSQQTCGQMFETAYYAARERFHSDPVRLEAQYRRTVEAELLKSIVLTRYNPRLRYRVDRIAWDMTADSTFTDDNGREVSFREYLQTKWNFTSDWTYEGLIVSKQKFRNKEGKKVERDVFLVPDACHRTGLTGKMKDDFNLKKAVSKETTVAPHHRTAITDRVVAGLNHAGAAEAKSNGNGFGVPMSFEQHPERVTAKVLPPPKLRIMSRGSAKVIAARQSGFSRDVERSAFVTRMTTRVTRWAMVYAEENNYSGDDAYNLYQMINKRWQAYGPGLGEPHYMGVDIRNRDRALPNWKAALDEVMVQAPQMVVVLLPRNTDAFYHLTSERGSYHGVVTQCMKAQQMYKKGRIDQVVTGMVRQMKAKNCSNPWLVEIPLKGHPGMLAHTKKGPLDTMLVGMDVNHDRKNDTSTVGFCTTYGDAANYFSQHRFQEFQKESITDAESLMFEALLFFKKKTGRLPKNVVIFRDGVSDSQFAMAVHYELRAYRIAASEIAKREQVAYTPKFTMVITQKRVSVRFTTADKKAVPPGTVVDTGVIAENVWNFYLHPCTANKQGHVVPTRFVVLVDEVGFSQNDMQTMCHNLCYAYPNWAGPIRVPCPAMMAHGVAFKFGSGRAQLCDRRSHNGAIAPIPRDNPKLAGKNHCL